MQIKRSLFYRYLLSYLLITAVPLLILGTVFYQKSIASLRHEVENANIGKLTQVKNIVDQRMQELSHLAFRISQDSRLSRFYLGKGEYEAIEAVEELRKYKANSMLIDHLFLTFQGDDSIYSSAGKFSRSSFHSYFYTNEEWNRERFFEEVNRLTRPTVKVLIDSQSDALEPPRVLGYMYPLSTSPQKTYGAVIFTIEQKMLYGLMGDVLGDFHGEAYMLDEEGRMLAGMRRGDKTISVREEALSADYGEPGVYRLNSAGESFSVVTVRSETSDWQFMTIIPTREFLGRVSETRTLILIIICIVALLGAGTAVFFASNHYRPFKKWVRLLQSESIEPPMPPDNRTGRENELELIGHTAYSALESYRALREKVLSQRDWLREQLFVRLLSGKVRDETEHEELTRAAELQFAGHAYRVLAVAIEPQEDGWSRLGRLYSALKSLAVPGYKLYVVEAPDEDALAVIVEEEEGVPDDGKERLLRIGETIRETARKAAETEPYIGMGEPCAAIDRLHRSYAEASAALAYVRLKKELRLCRFEEIVEGETKEFWYPIDEQILFTQSLKQGNQKLALENAEAIVGRIASQATSLLMLRYICFDIINSTAKTAQEIHRTAFAEQINSLMSFATIDQLKTRLADLTVKVCGYVDGLKASRNSELLGKMLKIVHERSMDPMFSLEGVADQVRVTPSYLSKFFKEQIGTTFSEYVTNLRMTEIKRQLVESDKPIKEIVESSGYADLSSFVRKFKAIEGVTPGQYRKLYTEAERTEQTRRADMDGKPQ